jgi:hypothetical protein
VTPRRIPQIPRVPLRGWSHRRPALVVGLGLAMAIAATACLPVPPSVSPTSTTVAPATSTSTTAAPTTTAAGITTPTTAGATTTTTTSGAPGTTTTTAGGTTTTTTAPPVVPKLLFGLGSEASSAFTDPLTAEAPVKMLSSWYNGPGDLSWLKWWKTGVIPKAYAAGDALHVIVYSNDANATIATKYGNACGRAYPLSAGFLTDMDSLAKLFAGTAGGPPLYVTMFTEFQTYPCNGNGWSVTPEATHYYQALKDQYLAALAIFHRDAPNAKVSLGWGGWQTRWDDPATGSGRSMFSHFADVMKASDFQSFQAMQSDTNLNDIVAMTQTLGAYGKVMLAHYKPDNGSQATFDADTKTIFSDAYLQKVTALGLFAFSFMDPKNESATATTHARIVAGVKRYGTGP